MFAAAAAISNNNNNKERQGGSDRTEAPYVSEMGGRIAYAFIADVYAILYLLQQVSLSFFFTLQVWRLVEEIRECRECRR